ncbi:response regulator [Roseomonas sp. BN140053]|uniref:response regulator n=1 Tax=Roseomonas sp. BN140053 TaxID=3391898 RepID=UPI0039EB7D2B
MHRTRRIRFAASAALLMLLAVQGIATALLLRQSHAGAEATANEQVERASRAVQAAINRSLLQVDAMLASLPAIMREVADDRGHLGAVPASRVLQELSSTNFAFRDVLLVRPDGSIFAAALPASRRRRLPISPLAINVSAGAPAGGLLISDPVRNPATGEWAVFLVRRVEIADVGPVFAMAEVQVSLIGTLLASGGDNSALHLLLRRSDGVLLASQPHDETRIGSRVENNAASRLNDAAAGTADDFVAEQPTLYASLAIIVSLRRDAALAAWERERDQVLWVSGGFAVLLIGAAAALLVMLVQRERADAERLRTKELLDKALESMNDGFCMFDADDRLVMFNSRYKEFYGVSAPFLAPGMRFEDIILEGARQGQYPQAGEDIRQFTAEMKTWHLGNNAPMERLLPDGRWILITERRTPDGGTVGIRTDITRLKRAMAELASARDAAAAAGEAKSRFLARVSHELRTPLNGILGWAQLLLRDEGLTAEQRGRLQTLVDAGEHLAQVVSRLLEVSRIEGSELQDFDADPVAPADVARFCADLVRPSAVAKGLELAVEIAPDLPAKVLLSAAGLRQVLLNLLGNAVKYTETGGITLRVGRLLSGDLRFEVEDTGPGIPAALRGRLFRDFDRLGAESGNIPGTGLGLSTSFQIAERLGGRLGCDSTIGQGTTFWVQLPAPEIAAAPVLPAAPAEPAKPAGLRVLVADDVATNRVLARAMLESQGHSVDVVCDGEEAVAAVRRAPYDLVLMDVHMPGLDGLQATRRIREMEGDGSRVPILAVTASAYTEDVQACLDAGMNGHVSKPIRLDALTAAMAAMAPGTLLRT